MPPPPPLPPLTDTVNGSGFGRNLYTLLTVNGAGARSAPTPSTGPIYTRTVNPSRAPVLYKVTSQPATGAFIVAWALDASPDIAGYLIYRAPDPAELTDLRWFGLDPTHPSDPSTLARAQITASAWHPLSLTPGTGDPRLIGVVNDSRAFARDYDGSDMGEVPLPPGTPPDDILGVYRLADFDPSTPADPARRVQLLDPRLGRGHRAAGKRYVGDPGDLPRHRAAARTRPRRGGRRRRPLRRRRTGDRSATGTARRVRRRGTPWQGAARPRRLQCRSLLVPRPGRRGAVLFRRRRRHRRQPVGAVDAVHRGGVRTCMTIPVLLSSEERHTMADPLTTLKTDLAALATPPSSFPDGYRRGHRAAARRC